jgi:hypothetical protein
LLPFAAFYMCAHGMYLCLCGLHARIAQYGDKRTHTQATMAARAHAPQQHADDMVAGFNELFFLLLFGAVFGMI